MPTKRRKRQLKFLLALLLSEIIVLILVSCNNGKKQDDVVPREVIDARIIATTPEPTSPPEPIKLNPISDSDLYWLARIMEAEDGVGWTDEDIMKLGEVALNRVASPDFPNTVKAVALQGVDGNGPVQYAPFINYDSWIPSPYYIYLSARLIDNGERVLNDPAVVWQALFVQGEIVDTVYDPYLGTTTYLCK